MSPMIGRAIGVLVLCLLVGLLLTISVSPREAF
jgi:hypothetical protein